MTLVETKRLEVNAQLMCWFVNFAEFSCKMQLLQHVRILAASLSFSKTATALRTR